MVDWPTDLPAEGMSGITDQRTGAKIRSEVDQGPAIQRRRYTAAVRKIDVPVSFTDDERAIFDTFFITTLQEGVLSFNYTDPRGGATRSFRFRSVDGPAWQGSNGGELKRWSATLELEIIA